MPIHPEDNGKPAQPAWLGVVKEHVESLRFGVVQIVVHDSRVVQIEKTEKVRLDQTDAKTSARHGSAAT